MLSPNQSNAEAPGKGEKGGKGGKGGKGEKGGKGHTLIMSERPSFIYISAKASTIWLTDMVTECHLAHRMSRRLSAAS